MSDAPEKPRKPRGHRAAHAPTAVTRSIVQVLHAAGIPHRILAKKVGVDEKTLRKHYREELDDAHLEVESSMVAAIVKAAQNGAWGAAKYWLTTHSKDERWRMPESHQIAGTPGGEPIRIELSDMSDEEIQRELDDIEQQQQDAAAARTMAAGVSKRSNGMGH